MAKEYCAILILSLILGSMVMQFIRARKRQRLVRRLVDLKMPEQAREKLNIVNQSFDPFFKDFRKLKVIRKFTNLLTEDYKDEYRGYKIFSRFEMSVTISMLLFCVFAFRICN